MQILIRILALVLFASLGKGANKTACPFLEIREPVKQYDYQCWDYSDGWTGCCRSQESCGSFDFAFRGLCYCTNGCKGWAVKFSLTRFNTGRGNGRDDQCIKVNNPYSVESLSNSCVKLWNNSGCTGQSIVVNGSLTIDNTTWTQQGLTNVLAISGCRFTQPKSKVVKLYQHNFWAWFGSSKKVTIKQGQCTSVGEWWENKVSLIDPINGDCYKIWENRDCSGNSYCDCGILDLSLGNTPFTKKLGNGWSTTDWNNKVKALSLCDFSSE